MEIFIYIHVGQPKSVKISFTFILYHIYINIKTFLRKKNTLEFQLRTLPFLYHWLDGSTPLTGIHGTLNYNLLPIV